MAHESAWPALPLAPWKDTRDTLHLYAQLVGKVRLALTAVEREWQNVPLYVTSRGLTTSPMAYGERLLEIAFDFVRHAVDVTVSDGGYESIPLVPALCVADFYAELMTALERQNVAVRIWPVSVETPKPIRCSEDRDHASYDADAVRRFWQVLVRVAAVFADYRAPFAGRHTLVQFFWGSFDIAYARFSGRPADPPPNADAMMRVAMDAQEIAAGFWPGDDRFPEPAFYSYAYPKPPGIERAPVAPSAAAWNERLGEFILPYEDVRRASSPREALVQFLTSTFAAGARAAHWDEAIAAPPPA